MSPLLAGLCALALASPPADAGGRAGADAARIREWVGQLGHPEFKTRSQAQQQLRAAGRPALPALRDAARTADSLEVRLRARETAEAIERDHWGRISTTGKAGTALLIVPPTTDPRGRGLAPSGGAQLTAVCVHPSGLFLAGSGSLGAATAGPIPLILHPGEKGEKLLKARVVRADRSLDLALLQVEEKGPFPALPLGGGEGVSELAEVMALAFPNPATWAPGAYPAPGAPRGVVTAVQMRDGEPARLRVEIKEAGSEILGPVLDDEGKLAGVVTDESTALERFTRAVDMGEEAPATRAYSVTSAGLVRKFLEPPVLRFSPPVVRDADRDRPATFRVEVVPTFPFSVPDTLELVLPGEETRKVKMTAEGGAWVARAVPLPGRADGTPLSITVAFEDGRLEARIPDRTIEAGGVKVRLSAVRSLTHKPEEVQATLADGKKLTLPASALEGLTVRIGGEERPIPFARAIQTTIRPPEPTPAVPCQVVASREGKELTRAAGIVVVLPSERRFALGFGGGRSELAVPDFVLDAGQPFTVEALVSPSQPGFRAMLGSPEARAVALELEGGEDPRWAVTAYGGGASWKAASKGPAGLKRRTHVAGVFDGSSLSLYVDGKRQGRVGLPAGNAFAGPLSSLTLGAAPFEDAPGVTSFAGLIEGVRVSRGARYAKDFAPPAAFEGDADTALLLGMNEGTGAVCYDGSGQHHHASVAGAWWVEVPPGGFTPDTLPADPSSSGRPAGTRNPNPFGRRPPSRSRGGAPGTPIP